jgi:hypothetical protein
LHQTNNFQTPQKFNLNNYRMPTTPESQNSFMSSNIEQAYRAAAIRQPYRLPPLQQSNMSIDRDQISQYSGKPPRF